MLEIFSRHPHKYNNGSTPTQVYVVEEDKVYCTSKELSFLDEFLVTNNFEKQN